MRSNISKNKGETDLMDELKVQDEAKQEESKAKVVQFTSLDKEGVVSHKLHLDKYYTPRPVADHTVEMTFELIGAENITEIVETSAGAGVFIDAVKDYLAKHNLDIPVYAYDLEPEREDIVQQDYLEFQQYYKPGRLIIGNPPFGSRMSLAKKFFQKAVHEGDYISWILPGGQYDNTNTLYEFDLSYSELLGTVEYSGTKPVNSCLNIYERPETKVLNTRAKNKQLKDISIYSEKDRDYDTMVDYDVRMVYWGSAGKILAHDDPRYAGEYKIKVHNKHIRDEVVDVLHTIDWAKEVAFSAMPRIKKRDIHKILKDEVKGIQ